MKVELAKLSPEDAVLAEKQHVCLVDGDMLGTISDPDQSRCEWATGMDLLRRLPKPLLNNPDGYVANRNK